MKYEFFLFQRKMLYYWGIKVNGKVSVKSIIGYRLPENAGKALNRLVVFFKKLKAS